MSTYMIFLNTFKNFQKDAKFKKKNHGSNIINVKVVKDRLERTNRFSSIEFFTEIPVSSVITQHHPLIQAYKLEYRHGCLIFAFTPSLLNVLFLSFFLSQNSSAFIVSKIVNQIITSSNRIIDGCNLVYPFLSINHHHLILSQIRFFV